MDVATFCRQSRVLVVAGKGGVGKTTITGALALVAARAGVDVLVVELEGKTQLAAAFGRAGSLDYEEDVLVDLRPGAGRVRARRITPDDALLEYLADHGMKRISKRLVSSGAIDVVATAIPGIRDILVLGKVKSLELQGAAELVLVDAPATGHVMTFLSSARGLLDAARSGPVRTQAADVLEMLSDPSRCQVALVTLPEEMPVNEVVEAAFALEDRVGVCLGPVVANGCLPPLHGLAVTAADAAAAAGVTLPDDVGAALDAAARFGLRRRAVQTEQLDRLADELPLSRLLAPFVVCGDIGPVELGRIADALQEHIEALPDTGVEHLAHADGALPARAAAAPAASEGAATR